MIFDILTLFPEICKSYCQTSVLGRAISRGLIKVRTINIRNYAQNRHHSVDDIPYGGGNGMVLMGPPLARAIESLEVEPIARVILMSPQGLVLTQNKVQELVSSWPRLVLICGRYEGIDERVRELYVHEELSIGDFIISGGELAALCIIDAVSRLIPGVLHGIESAATDSFMNGLLEHPHYTRPVEFGGLRVPEVLMSGNHIAIARWRRKESLRRTLLRRPILLKQACLSKDDLILLEEVHNEIIVNNK